MARDSYPKLVRPTDVNAATWFMQDKRVYEVVEGELNDFVDGEQDPEDAEDELKVDGATARKECSQA